MSDKIKIAINWAGACGGCDVSLLDLEDNFLQIVDMADIVYWPVAMDLKRKDLRDLDKESVHVGIFNGVVRTSEQADDAFMLRQRCKILIAYGSCACCGGIPGLANVSDKEEIFDLVYQQTPSTINPAGVMPQTSWENKGFTLHLPEFFDTVKALHQLVDVDYFLPGCPPTEDRILDAVNIIIQFQKNRTLPPKGTIIASQEALCRECQRADTKTADRLRKLLRPHEVVADPNLCFLEQGIICMGPFTRGGCGGLCINANMPCRGCFGPNKTQTDPGVEALSSFGSVVGPSGEDFLSRNEMKNEVNLINDPLGTFYRFTLPTAVINRRVRETKDK